MHLPRDVQMVALSATLRDPESFLGWISSTRSRPADLVRRFDRQVPLHVGGLERPRGEFVEFYGTHGPRKNVFEMERYAEIRNAISNPPAADGAHAHAAAAARMERAG